MELCGPLSGGPTYHPRGSVQGTSTALDHAQLAWVAPKKSMVSAENSQLSPPKRWPKGLGFLQNSPKWVHLSRISLDFNGFQILQL